MGDNPKVFISHASEDKDRFVRAFVVALKSKGVDAWFDELEIKVGDSLIDKIFEEGIGQAEAVIAVLSKNSINKPWVRKELNTATVKKIGGKLKIIPVVIDEVEVPTSLIDLKYSRIDIDIDYSSQLHDIIRSIFENNDKPLLGPKPVFIEQASGKEEVSGLRSDESQFLKILERISKTVDS